MAAVDVVRELIEAFTAGAPRDGLFAADFRVVGQAPDVPLQAFGIPDAAADDDGEISFEGFTASEGEHVLVWGTWSGDGGTDATYHVVIEVQAGKAVESRFFDDLEQARWFAGL